MANMIPFTKMHGAGNDYIYVNTLLYNIPDPAKAAIEWSKPHFAIGSDGLVLIGKPSSNDADFSMRIFNNDGSEAMMCGNASRCIGKYLHDKNLTDRNPIRLETLSGIKTLTLCHDSKGTVESVTVDMLEPATSVKEQCNTSDGSAKDHELKALGETFRGTFVSMGNPHFVCFIDNVEDFDIYKYGPILEHDPLFPQRCNIEFAQVIAPGVIRMRVWERGSGVTMACGTGACATAVAAALTSRCGRKSDIKMDGGTLTIEWAEDSNHVLMTGPAAFAFEGEIALP